MSIDQEIIDELESKPSSTKLVYFYCPTCKNKAWLTDNHAEHNESNDIDNVDIQGVAVINEVIESDEEKELMKLIDNSDLWKTSQEGRCKQDFGPRVNFLAKKASVGNFIGFPLFAANILSRLQKQYEELLSDFMPVEFCILEYSPERGSYIRPHYDDTWIWGDRLVTVNLLSDTILRLTREYNTPPYEIAIKMPARSLVVVYGDARYKWHHSIKKFDIKARRIAMTWREFSEEITSDQELDEFVADVYRISKVIL